MLQRVLRRVSAGALLVRCVSSGAGSSLEPGLALAPGWHADLPGAKKIVFIRHAEGWHNKDAREIPNYFKDELGLASTSLKYWDAALTPDGETQCAALASRLQDATAALTHTLAHTLTHTLAHTLTQTLTQTLTLTTDPDPDPKPNPNPDPNPTACRSRWGRWSSWQCRP